MIVAFFGHRDFISNNEFKEKIKSILNDLVGDNSVEFYLGGYGHFDSFAYLCCKDFTETHNDASLVFVTPYISEEYQRNHLTEITKKYHSVIYPEIENLPRRFAITYRNKYMVEKADLIICYVKREYGGAFQAIKYAERKGKRIINIAEKTKYN